MFLYYRLVLKSPPQRMESSLEILVSETHPTTHPPTHAHTHTRPPTHTYTHTVYDIVGSTADRNCVVLNNIHIDIMDYIQPDTCTDSEFRKMWAEFEWENKIAVSTNIGEVGAYLDHILESTNMNCLTPKQVSCDSHVTTCI